MKFLFLLLSLNAMAIEVATVEETKPYTDVMFVFTDESLYSGLEKQWMTKSCKSRIVINNSVRENYAIRACRAEIVKFLLDSGYKTIDQAHTFVK